MNSGEENGPKIRAGFILVGHQVEPDRITQALGLQPSVTWREGEPRLAQGPLMNDTDGWAIRTDYEESLNLPSHVDRILDVVHPLSGQIRKLCSELKLEAELECVVRIARSERQSVPIMNFESNVINRMADLGADLDIDIVLVPPSTS